MAELIAWLVAQWKKFTEFCKGIWDDFGEWATDIPVLTLEKILDAVADLFNAIPVPAFMSQGLNGLFLGLGSDVLYFLSQAGITQGLAVIGLGVLFNLTRKLLTLGQW